MSSRTIPIDQLAIGMYVCGIDRPWMDTPFLRHRFLINAQGQIDKLKQCGVKKIAIDLDRGIDVQTSTEDQQAHTQTSQEEGAVNTERQELQEAEERIAHLPPTLRGKSLSHELSSTRDIRGQMLETVGDLLSSVATSGVVQASHVKELTQDIISQTLDHEDAFIALIRTNEFSTDLHEHSLSVGTLAVLLGRLIGFDDAQLQILGAAALLHDVGLVRLPPALLSPKNRQTPQAFAHYQSHPQLSLEIVRESSGLPDQVQQIVEAHHVLLDGTGYPDSLTPETVPMSSRLLRVVDEYDELLTGQQGLPPMSGKEALRTLYQRGQQGQLDQQFVTQFIAQVGIYPIYSLVELNTGERGIVTSHSQDNLLHPTILLIQDASRQAYHDPIPINFSTLHDSNPVPEIVKVLDPEREGIHVENVLADWITI
ncbi:MAG: DUF3391 domain-containing protein [Nitrospirales bacterium]|nr:DUF3391 domain-containing protein [Nitrospira sp.]MDR4501799.1 DUF3391 domain-containing protein [Nitrospirales bacterium]